MQEGHNIGPESCNNRSVLDCEDARNSFAEEAIIRGANVPLGRLNKEKPTCSPEQPDENSDSLVEDNSVNIQLPLWREIAFISVISLSQLLTQASIAQSLTPLHIIGNAMGITENGELSWIIAAYSLTVGTFILPAGRWGDVFGHRKLFIFGYVWFGIWSGIAGFSVYSNYMLLMFCRAIQGIGPAILLPSGIALLGRSYPPGRRKNFIIGIYGACAPSGFCFGALFSSIFSEFAWWPWCFWAAGLVCLGLSVISIYVIPISLDHREHPVVSPFQKLDIIGSAIGVTGLILFNLAWNQAPLSGWNSPWICVVLVLSIIFIAFFFIYEARFAKYPILPADSLSLNTNFVFICIALGWMSFGNWIYYYWQINEVIKHTSPLITALRILPVSVSGFCAAISVGALLSMGVHPSAIMLGALVSFTVGNILLATMPVNQIYWAQMFVSTCIMPWGMDMSFPSGTILLSDSMAPEHQGIAASLINTVVNYSVSIGLGFAGTIEVNIDKNGDKILKGYRSSLYFAIGTAGLGVIVSLIFVFISHRKPAKSTVCEI
ncbi:major facilitator superfamily-domain-containing protein [Dipodascopsis uninucleata]